MDLKDASEKVYRIALATEILALEPSYVWTAADMLDAATMNRDGIDAKRAAAAFVRTRRSDPNLTAALTGQPPLTSDPLFA